MERKPRIIFFEDDPNIRKMMELLAESNGCEIITYEDPSKCPLHKSHNCQCGENEMCADIMITDIDMPHVSGIDFIEDQINKGCRAKNFGVLSGVWTDENIERAKKLGCTVFQKPSFLYVISEWIETCLQRDKRHLNLSNWFIDQ